MRKLASIRTIDNVSAIDGADNIVCVTIGGWKCVAKKGEFKQGDLCVYFEVDSILPASDERYQFLAKTFKEYPTESGKLLMGHRLKTIKLRGQISQGLALPLTAFTEITTPTKDVDVTGLLQVQKYESSISSTGGTSQSGKTRTFPEFLIKSDQERCQNISKQIFADMDKQYEVTQKLDGSSATFFHKDGVVGLCSRNLQLATPNGINAEPSKPLLVRIKQHLSNLFSRKVKVATQDDLNSYWHQAAEKYNIFNLLKQYGKNIALQGEIIAPSIQQNHEKVAELLFYVYAVQDINTRSFLPPAQARATLAEINQLHGGELKYVPVLHEVVSLTELGLSDVDALLAYAEGRSILSKACTVREGLVFKAVDGSYSFKAISNAYLLKKDKKD